jgi:methanogenic corrinoid protein MtbC1
LDRSINTAEEGPFESSRRPEGARPPELRDVDGWRRATDAGVGVVPKFLLKQDLIDRLMTAHLSPLLPTSGPVGVAAASMRVAVGPAQVQALVDISLNGEAEAAREFVFRLRDKGVSIESLYLDLITPAARRIGAMWEADTCDFVLVTLALLRIQQVTYDLSPDFISDGAEPSSRRALIVPAPGSHHTLGAAMVADFFRRDGWDVLSSHELSRADVLRVLRQDWFDLVAVSISAPNQILSSSALISDIRKLSSNRGILVMVGGPLALSVPDLAARVGADMVTLDAKQAVDVAGRAVPVRRTSVVN